MKNHKGKMISQYYEKKLSTKQREITDDLEDIFGDLKISQRKKDFISKFWNIMSHQKFINEIFQEVDKRTGKKKDSKKVES